MDNRPHSRQRRYSNESKDVNKHEFSSGSSNYSRGYSSSNRGGSPLGLLALLAYLFKRKSNTTYTSGRRKSSSLWNIIKIVIIVFVIIKVIGFFTSSSNNSSSNNSFYPSSSNNNYNSDTSSSNLNYDVTSGTRDKFTKILGNNNDEVTVMVYMIGTDLESGYGAASKDLQEMYYAGIDDNINIVIETGGCNKWQINGISNKYIERYTINSQGLYQLQSNIASEPMVEAEVLTDFIKYAASNFKANRYMLILWDHGGGSVTGYGYDEKYPYAGSMSPADIAKALKDSGIKFDMVGFDACLMANIETAMAIEPYADYMIASEETEPGEGWYYTDWLKLLDSNTSIKTVDLGKQIIDDYVNENLRSSRNAELTQSIVDLGELKYLTSKPLATFSKSISNSLENNEYTSIASARSNTKEFSKSSKLDQVDLIDLADNFDIDGSKELIKAIKNAVKYNRSENTYNAYGLSAYFPYSSLNKMNEMATIYDDINMDEDYAKAIKTFASYASSGQILTQNSNSSSTSLFDILGGSSYSGSTYSQNDIYSLLTNSLLGNNGYSSTYNGYNNYYGYGSYSDILGGSSWLDSSLLNGISSYFGRSNLVDTSKLQVTNKNGTNVISLSEDQWSLIDTVELQMFVDDGQGYIDLGLDNVFEFDEDGDLLAQADGTWLTLNDHFVSYYLISDEYVSDDEYRILGKIPAYLNNEKVNIIVEFTNTNPYGLVLGAKPIYEESDAQAKGYIEIVDGDEIKFICNYYTYDGKFIDEYQLGDTLIVHSELQLYNTKINNDYVYTYCFTDKYQNKMWTNKLAK